MNDLIVLKMLRTLPRVPDPRDSRAQACKDYLGPKYLLSSMAQRIPFHNVLRDGVKNG